MAEIQKVMASRGFARLEEHIPSIMTETEAHPCP
jgi:hypothetical protein